MRAADPPSVWATGAWLVLVAGYAVLSAVWTGHDPGWYASLARPSFQPPDLVFAVIWPLNFLALFAVGVWFTRSVGDAAAWGATVVLGTSIVAALTWAWLFYVPTRSVGSYTDPPRLRRTWPAATAKAATFPPPLSPDPLKNDSCDHRWRGCSGPAGIRWTFRYGDGLLVRESRPGEGP